MSRETTIFATANACGIALYTYLFLRIVQQQHDEQRADPDFGDGLAFLATAFLVLAVFAVVDLIWLVVMANQHRKHRDSKAGLLAGLLAIVAWFAAVFALRQVP